MRKKINLFLNPIANVWTTQSKDRWGQRHPMSCLSSWRPRVKVLSVYVPNKRTSKRRWYPWLLWNKNQRKMGADMYMRNDIQRRRW